MRRLDKAIIGGMFVLGILAIIFLAGVHEPVYTQSISLSNHTDSRFEKIKYDAHIILSAKTFSANSPIIIQSAKVEAYPNPYVNSSGVNIPTKLRVIFPFSHFNPPIYSSDRSFIGAGYIEVFHDEERDAWFSTRTEQIQYEMQGCYLVGVTKDFTEFTMSNDATEETPCSELNIASSDAMTSLQIGRMTIFLAVIGIAISIFALRASMVQKIPDAKSNKGQSRGN